MTSKLYSVGWGFTSIVAPLPFYACKDGRAIAPPGAKRAEGLLRLYKHRMKKAWSHYISASSPLWHWVDPRNPGNTHLTSAVHQPLACVQGPYYPDSWIRIPKVVRAP